MIERFKQMNYKTIYEWGKVLLIYIAVLAFALWAYQSWHAYYYHTQIVMSPCNLCCLREPSYSCYIPKVFIDMPVNISGGVKP
jgi:hypothetical protein